MKNKTVLITGAGSGIGKASALKFAEEQANLILVSRTESKLKEVQGLCQALTPKVNIICADLSQEKEVTKIFRQNYQFDIAINNAGIEGKLGDTTSLTLNDFDQIIANNLRSLWQCLQEEVSYFRKQNKSGSIINVSSVAGILGIANSSLYCMSKHAVIGLTKSVALEQIPHGIRINSICPGAVDTPMFERVMSPHKGESFLKKKPIGRMATPSEIAEAIFWLSSEKSSYVVGHSMIIDGGISLD